MYLPGDKCYYKQSAEVTVTSLHEDDNGDVHYTIQMHPTDNCICTVEQVTPDDLTPIGYDTLLNILDLYMPM